MSRVPSGRDKQSHHTGMPAGDHLASGRMPRHAVLLAGGRGTRLGPMTRDLPKPLLPIQGISVIERLIDQLRDAGVERCTVVTCHRAHEVEAHLGDGRHLGVAIDTLREDRPLGTAGCLGLLPRPDRPFLLINGDIVTDLCFCELGRRHLQDGAVATVAVHRHRLPLEFGVVDVDAEGRLREYREKPVHEVFVAMGIACLEPRVCDHVVAGESVTLPDLLVRLMARAEHVSCHAHEGLWMDIGRPQDYAACQSLPLPSIHRGHRRVA